MLKINLCVLLHFKGSKKVKNHSTIFENEKVEDCPHVKLVKTAQNKSCVMANKALSQGKLDQGCALINENY